MNPINSALNNIRSMPKAEAVTPEIKEKRLTTSYIHLGLGKLNLDELKKVDSYVQKMLIN